MPARPTNDEYFALTSYPPVARDDTESEGLLQTNEANGEAKRVPRQVAGTSALCDQLTTLLLFLAFFVSLLSFGTTFYLEFIHSRSSVSGPYASGYYNVKIDDLKKPSQYLGLERVDGSIERLEQELAHNGTGQGEHGGASSSSNGSMAMDNPPPSLPVGPGRATSIVRINERFPNATFQRDGWVLLTNQVRLVLASRSEYRY